ncbi:MAG TPA: hypothetical protein DEA08_09140 [Planctomycetes bacterium]|nr:hypothetical protein [Planctomycetota bacterium]
MSVAAASAVAGPYHQSRLVLWQRCPRRYWFQHVAQVEPDYAVTGYAGPLGVAGHVGCQLVLRDPAADREEILEAMLGAFEEELAKGQSQGRTYDPEQTERALERLETEHVEFVLKLAQDPRVRAIDWSHTELPFEWTDQHGRVFRGTVDAIGRAREYVPGFSVLGRERVDLEPGEWVLVDWKFGRELELTRVGLSLNPQLAFYSLAAAKLFPGRRFRTCLGALRDLASSQRPTDAEGQAIPKTLEELNPAYVEAFTGGQPITDELRARAEKSRRRFRRDGVNVPKRIKRTNPAWEAARNEPKGPLFHEAQIAWNVVAPTLRQTIHEIEIAGRDGGEEAFPARGPVTGGCRFCPFHRECVARPAE